MFTYQSTKILPYVYMCKEKQSNKFYIGYRSANKTPSTADFGQKYFTSNKYVKENFDKFDHYILAEFFNKRDAYRFESELIKLTKCDDQINSFRDLLRRGKKKKPSQPVDTSVKLCALASCQKPHTNWRMKCCCMSHQKKYAGSRAH